MLAIRPAVEIDREQVPEPHNTFERPWVYYTYIVPSGTLCEARCGLFAHAGIFVMDEENLAKWETQEGKVEGDITYWCALDYAKAVIGEIEPQEESEPREMTEEEMGEEWDASSSS